MKTPASPIRDAYLAGAAATVSVLESAEVMERWPEQSVLPGMTIGALAAHVSRSIFLVEDFLAAAEPESTNLVDAGAYFGGVRDQLVDPDSAANAGVEQRAADDAGKGAAGLQGLATAALASLEQQLHATPGDRRLVAFGGRTIELDEFLRTRCVEFAVHLDDLNASLSADVPIPESTIRQAITVMVDAARSRCGDLYVLRALTRAERADIEILRGI